MAAESSENIPPLRDVVGFNDFQWNNLERKHEEIARDPRHRLLSTIFNYHNAFLMPFDTLLLAFHQRPHYPLFSNLDMPHMTEEICETTGISDYYYPGNFVPLSCPNHPTISDVYPAVPEMMCVMGKWMHVCKFCTLPISESYELTDLHEIACDPEFVGLFAPKPPPQVFLLLKNPPKLPVFDQACYQARLDSFGERTMPMAKPALFLEYISDIFYNPEPKKMRTFHCTNKGCQGKMFYDDASYSFRFIAHTCNKKFSKTSANIRRLINLVGNACFKQNDISRQKAEFITIAYIKQSPHAILITPTHEKEFKKTVKQIMFRIYRNTPVV